MKIKNHKSLQWAANPCIQGVCSGVVFCLMCMYVGLWHILVSLPLEPAGDSVNIVGSRSWWTRFLQSSLLPLKHTHTYTHIQRMLHCLFNCQVYFIHNPHVLISLSSPHGHENLSDAPTGAVVDSDCPRSREDKIKKGTSRMQWGMSTYEVMMHLWSNCYNQWLILKVLHYVII